MNREDIIRLAREAGFVVLLPEESTSGIGSVWPDEEEDATEKLTRFAALVAAAEREACAKVCEALGNDASIDEMEYRAFREADEAIRARGEGKQ